MDTDFQVTGKSIEALFTLKIHRGEGMALLAMNWKQGTPPDDFVGFAIEYKEPGGDRFFGLNNRISFPKAGGDTNPNILTTRLSPIQMFRWVHFPFHPDLPGPFTYKVTPVFMDKNDMMSFGEPQQAALELRRETFPGQLNVCFTRGFVSSQAFVDRWGAGKKRISDIIPDDATKGLTFHPTRDHAEDALSWMGFEARGAILGLLDEAIADPTAKVFVVAYDLNEPQLVNRLKQLGNRVKVIIDNNKKDHGLPGSAEEQAENMLVVTAGRANVKRQHMGGLQHNKTIVVNGQQVKAAIGGSTNLSWRGFYVQNNNAIVVRGKDAIQPFLDAFNNYFANNDQPAVFGATGSAEMNDLKLPGIDVKVAFSPHIATNKVLDSIASDIADHTTSSLFFSLAFLYQTDGVIKNAIIKIRDDDSVFSYGISDKKVGGLDVTKPNGKVSVIKPAALSKHVPEPFKSEPAGGSGVRMHHKFVVIDFDKPTARVYTGSYNFSIAADDSNGENLWLIKDRRIATAYTVEALSMFDHYNFRVLQEQAKTAQKKIQLKKPPGKDSDIHWWDAHYTDPRKIIDRELFA